jgi:integrase
MPRKATERAHGPYRHGNRWRVICTGAGARRAESFATEDEARDFISAFNAGREGKTVGDVLVEYRDHLKLKGRKARTIRLIETAITRMVPLDTRVNAVGVTAARRMYAVISTGPDAYAPDTHHLSLRYARLLWERIGGVNPWEHVERVGVSTVGKEQLTLDESRRLVAACVKDGRPIGTATLLCLLLALRAGEVVALVGRDIDDGGRLLHVWRGKTRRARRSLEVPETLQAPLRELARSAGTDGRLFKRSLAWVGYAVETMCDLAGVPLVCPHGLRGTHATLAASAGVTAHVVASALGHAGPAVTRRHYLAPGTEDAADARALGTRLVQERPSRSQASDEPANPGGYDVN